MYQLGDVAPDMVVWSLTTGLQKCKPLDGQAHMVTVRPAQSDDASAWLKMRLTLWPDGSEAEHSEEIGRFFNDQVPDQFPREPWAVLLAESIEGGMLGFAELSIRPCAEGCRSNRVAYLEGWFVLPEARNGGVGRALVVAAEEWGRGQGCTEFASDTQRENDVSSAAHRALGFTDVGMVRCFLKKL